MNVAVLPPDARVCGVAPGARFRPPRVPAKVGCRRHFGEDSLRRRLRVGVVGEPLLALEAVFGRVDLALVEAAVALHATR
jgi:hypothetical protein